MLASLNPQKRHDSTGFFGVECLFSLIYLCGLYFRWLYFCNRSVWSSCLILRCWDFYFVDLQVFLVLILWKTTFISFTLRIVLPLVGETKLFLLQKSCLQFSKVQRRICGRFCPIFIWTAFFVKGLIVEMW